MKTKSLKFLNKKRNIYDLFNVPDNVRNQDNDFSSFYSFRYLRKKQDNGKLHKFDRFKSYLLSNQKRNPLLNSRPIDFSLDRYRIILNYRKEAVWLKKAQKKLHKYIVRELGDITYLHSTIRSKSYATNAFSHKSDKYFLVIDLRNFFTYVNREVIKSILQNYLDIDSDVANFYSKLVTSPKDEPPYHNNEFNLGQGLPSSPIMAFLSYKSLFDYLNEYSNSLSINMTVYVDDIVFSSNSEIKQQFINRLFGLFKYNGLEINKNKFRLYKPITPKKITGAYINEGHLKIPYRKHEELYVLYKEICRKIDTLKCFDDYLYIYNLYLKFCGNFQYLMEVEGRNKEGKVKLMRNYKKYDDLIKTLNDYMPRGIKKIKKAVAFSQSNINKSDLEILRVNFETILEKKFAF